MMVEQNQPEHRIGRGGHEILVQGNAQGIGSGKVLQDIAPEAHVGTGVFAHQGQGDAEASSGPLF